MAHGPTFDRGKLESLDRLPFGRRDIGRACRCGLVIFHKGLPHQNIRGQTDLSAGWRLDFLRATPFDSALVLISFSLLFRKLESAHEVLWAAIRK
jgi:hypothetical protein